MICYTLFNMRLSLFNKISHQSFTHTTRHSAKTQHSGVIFNISTEGITINRSYNPANALQDKIKYKKTKTKTTFDSLIKLEGEWAEGGQWRRHIIILKDIICHGLCWIIHTTVNIIWQTFNEPCDTVKRNFEKAEKTAIRFNLLQFLPSLPFLYLLCYQNVPTLFEAVILIFPLPSSLGEMVPSKKKQVNPLWLKSDKQPFNIKRIGCEDS